MRQRHRLQQGQEDDFTLRNLSEVLAAREESGRIMGLLLAAVASVSLLVGGIGIMNIMLVSVTERTREIGLRMAVGARGRDILTQFLVEAITLALIGGLLGVALGIGSTLAIAQFAGWPIRLGIEPVALAVGFAGAIGIFFGFYPARKASRLLPIEALRYE
jgi:putative ABC transport system permease protein